MTGINSYNPCHFMDADGNLDIDPWAPPQNLTIEILKTLDDLELWLADAINLMAFGDRAALSSSGNFQNDPDIEPGNPAKVNFRNITKRIGAARALFDAARDGKVTLSGSPREDSDTRASIPGNYFSISTPRALGREDNTIETDPHRVSFEGFKAACGGKHQKWWNVCVKTASFVRLVRGKIDEAPAGTNLEIDLNAPAEDQKPTPKQAEIIRNIKELWPKGDYPADVGVHNKKIRDRYKEKGLTPPGDTNIWRAFKFLK